MSPSQNHPANEFRRLQTTIEWRPLIGSVVLTFFVGASTAWAQTVIPASPKPAVPSPTPKPRPPAKRKALPKNQPVQTESDVPKPLKGAALKEAIREAELEKVDPRAKEPVPVIQKADESFETRMLRKNREWSEMFDGMAEGIDVYLIGKKVTKRKNETSIAIENSTYIEKGGAHNTSTLNADIRLPNVEDYWQLKFTSYDEQADRRGVKRGTYRQNPRPQNYGASLGLTQSLGRVKTIFQPRVELKNPLRIAHSLIFESVADLKTYVVNPKFEFFANPEKGTGVFLAVNTNFILDETYSLLWINDGEYEENRNLLTTNNGLSLLQIISDSSSFSYGLFINSNSRPNYHLNSYSFSIAWSQMIYRNILDYQIIPHLDFSTSHFAGTPGLIININLTF